MKQADMISKSWRMLLEPSRKRVPKKCPLCGQNILLLDGLLEVHSRADRRGRPRQEFCSRSSSALGRSER